MIDILPQLDVKNRKISLNDTKVVKASFDLEDKSLKIYSKFFRKQLEQFSDFDDNYKALEIINDSGRLVTSHLSDLPNFKVCHLSLIELLSQDASKLSDINLVHALMPIEEASTLVNLFKKIPDITNAKTRVLLGAYDDYETLEHEQNRRVLRGVMNGLDFWNYKREDNDGVCVRMVYSAYQKNMKMRH